MKPRKDSHGNIELTLEYDSNGHERAILYYREETSGYLSSIGHIDNPSEKYLKHIELSMAVARDILEHSNLKIEPGSPIAVKELVRGHTYYASMPKNKKH